MSPIVMLNGFYKLSASAVLDISMGRCTKVPTRTAEGRTLVRTTGTLNPLPKALQMQTAFGRGDAKPLAKSAATVWYAEGRALVRAPGTLNPLPKALHHIVSLTISRFIGLILSLVSTKYFQNFAIFTSYLVISVQ